jgi:hypothetical protein
MIVSNQPSRQPTRRLQALLLCSCLLLPLGATYARDTGPEVDSFGAPQAGVWNAASSTADAVTGDIRLSESEIVVANRSSLPIRPAYPGAEHVFAVDPATDPVMLNDNHLCASPVTYVTLLSYNAFALAIHMHDGARPPNEPTSADVSEFARKGKCASYYYYSSF